MCNILYILNFQKKMKVISQINIDKTIVIYTVVDSGKVVRKKLADKITGTGMDAVLPITALTGSTKKEVFVVSKQKDKFYLTKFFTTD